MLKNSKSKKAQSPKEQTASVIQKTSSDYEKMAKSVHMNILSISEDEYRKKYTLVTDLPDKTQSILFMNDVYLIQVKKSWIEEEKKKSQDKWIPERILLVHYLDKIDMGNICNDVDFDEVWFADDKTMKLFIQENDSIGKEINDKVGGTDYIKAILTKARITNITDIYIGLYGRELIIEFRGVAGKAEVARHGIKEARIIRNNLEYLADVENVPFFDSIMSIDSYEYRITFFETIQGFTFSIRVYANDEFGEELTLKALGYTPRAEQMINSICEKRDGLILYVAPTGHGKTTTSYANSLYLKKRGLQIYTIENPVEKRFDYLPQIDLSRYESADGKFKLTSERAFELLLRSKPDAINMGEIRNVVEANLAYLASTTGHLVLGTTHATSVSHTFTRLVKASNSTSTQESSFTIDDLKTIIKGIIAQRLTRALCNKCKIKTDETHFKANLKGCPQCVAGYERLRTPVVEIAIFPLSQEFDVKNPKTFEDYLSLNDSTKEKYDMGIIDFLHYDAIISGKQEPVIKLSIEEIH